MFNYFCHYHSIRHTELKLIIVASLKSVGQVKKIEEFCKKLMKVDQPELLFDERELQVLNWKIYEFWSF